MMFNDMYRLVLLKTNQACADVHDTAMRGGLDESDAKAIVMMGLMHQTIVSLHSIGFKTPDKIAEIMTYHARMVIEVVDDEPSAQVQR